MGIMKKCYTVINFFNLKFSARDAVEHEESPNLREDNISSESSDSDDSSKDSLT